MKTDLIASDLINNPSKEADTLYEQCHTTWTTLIDKHQSRKKSLVERKPGLFWKRWKKSLVSFFLGLIHIKIKDEAKLTYYFNQLPFRPFDLKMFSGT